MNFITTVDINREKIEGAGNQGKRCWLIDTSVYCRFEEAASLCGVDLFEVIDTLPNEEYFFLNNALIELANGPRSQMDVLRRFIDHMICAEGGGDPTHKENRFLIEEEGEVRYVVLNKVSNTDWMQINTAQNYTSLLLVSNDTKMIRSASYVLPGRAYGTQSFLSKLLEANPTHSGLKTINSQCELMFRSGHAFKRTGERTAN